MLPLPDRVKVGQGECGCVSRGSDPPTQCKWSSRGKLVDFRTPDLETYRSTCEGDELGDLDPWGSDGSDG